MKMVCYMASGNYINLDATRLGDQEHSVEVWNNDTLVALIAKDNIEAIYLTQKKEKEDRKKMIKIGQSHFRPEAIQAIAPATQEGKWVVSLSNGALINIEASKEDIRSATRALVSYDEMLDFPQPEIPLKKAEKAQLITLLSAGYRWVARDKSGQLFAYANRPEKHGASWEDDPEDGCPTPRRFEGDGIERITYEDTEPMMIEDLLALSIEPD